MTVSARAMGEALVGLVADLLVELGIRARPDSETAELRALLTTAWSNHLACPDAGSSLTSSGAPFEVSIKLDAGDQLALRYVVDTADHRCDLAGNRGRYLDHARAISGAPDLADELVQRHLDGVAPGEPARVMHGVGFAARDQRRATLYFPTSRLSPDELGSRLVGDHPTVTGPVEVVGYDLAGGRISRCKTYQWLPLDALAATDADLGPAAALHRTFSEQVPTACHDRALFLQLARTGDATAAKVFFFCQPWGWQHPEGLLRLLSFLRATFGLDLAPLRLLRTVAGRHGVRLTVGLLAVGAGPTVTFYFWPL